MKDTIKNKKPSFVIFPLLIWLGVMCLGIIYLVPFLANNESEEISILFIIVSIVERIAVAIGTLGLTRQYKMNQNIWALLAFFFGLNQLLFLNIAIWIHSSKHENDDL